MSKKIKSKKDVLIAVGGAVVVLILVDLTPIGGNTISLVNHIRCGGGAYRTPVFAYGYSVPSYEKVDFRPGLFQGYPSYFCTPEEAERAGYSADPKMYKFPHLPDSEFESAIDKSKSL